MNGHTAPMYYLPQQGTAGPRTVSPEGRHVGSGERYSEPPWSTTAGFSRLLQLTDEVFYLPQHCVHHGSYDVYAGSLHNR